MKPRTSPRISPPELDKLMSHLEVEVIALSECLVGAGFRLDLDGNPAPGIHYVLAGRGTLSLHGAPDVAIGPHTLVVVPQQTPFQLEARSGPDGDSTAARVSGAAVGTTVDSVRRYRAGDDAPEVVMICGYFRAHYGASTGLFENLGAPIVERFAPDDRLDDKLKSALAELLAQEIGAGAMSAALLKQVILALLRRSLGSLDLWVERFALLSDPQIAKVFAAMVAHPGANHTVESLADSAFLSRSAFMARFAGVVGRPPMLVLRDLRMKQAAAQLAAGSYSVDQIVRNAGYASRASFARAFRQVLGVDPAAYRARELESSGFSAGGVNVSANVRNVNE